MSSIVLATENMEFEKRVRKALGSNNGELRRASIDLSDEDRIVVDLTGSAPAVIALGPDIEADTAFELAGRIDQEHPEISVVVVTPRAPGVYEKALKAGVRDVIDPKAATAELERVFARATGIAEKTRDNLADDTVTRTTSGKVISVVAPKGGSGKTALAINLGVGLAQRYPGQVALLDLDLLFGDVTNSLLLQPEHSISDAAEYGRLDATSLKVFLTQRAGGLHILCAPDDPARGEEVPEAVVVHAVQLLAREFKYVIIDTAAGMAEVTLAALELSTDLAMICDMSVSAVRGMRKVVDALNRLDSIQAERHFFMNRADSKVGLTIADVETTVGSRVSVRIPSSRLVPRSMNEGVPIIESAPKSPVAKSFVEAVDLFADGPPTGRRRRG